jgi:hypothetical protein
MKKRKLKVGKTYRLPEPFDGYTAKLLSNGRLRVTGPRRVLADNFDECGYPRYSLYGSGQRLDVREHYVAYALATKSWEFREYLKANKMELDHRDRVVTNNNPSNIRMVDAVKQVQNRSMSKIANRKAIKFIYKALKAETPCRVIAEKLGCSAAAVNDVALGRSNISIVKELGLDFSKVPRPRGNPSHRNPDYFSMLQR